ncbi:ABC transporter substrate-binding protein [Caldicoprobacter faecalis]|uniref:Carbohydrate ABC transporter substrate-binding protein, CUT1 family n=1 Tax=Caldicoprobacter faecalis TaxID=937334 RepID=A0A1I5WIL0_9FIRM|nr:ABC transporter substrate-binding protein [Caldicoprobacter faecalis]SFQ19461.1 carbohydrate ABC transporter substrate-binding protein, CUT1 family [Caldicoprobacter faecalis]
MGISKMPKAVCLCLAMVLFLVMLGGCSSQGNENGANQSSSAANQSGSSNNASESTDTGNSKSSQSTQKEKTKIVFWHNWATGPSGESIKKSVEEFNKSQDDIIVEPLFVATDAGDSITSKLLTAVAAGNPPDVMLASRYGIAEYMDAVTILNDLAERDNINADMFYEWAWEEATYDGQLLGLPYDGTARALFYNKDHFKEAGLDPEKPPLTISELEEYAKKLTIRENGKITRFGFIPWYGEGWLYTWGWAFGGEFYDKETGKVTANHPKIVEALTWMTSFAEQFGIENVTNFTSSAGSAAMNPFISGQLSMMVTGNWMIAQIEQYNPDLNYGISYIPTPDGKNFTTYVGGRALIIPKGVKNLEEAWTFVKWMCTSEEAQSLKKMTGEFSARPDVNAKIYGDDPRQKIFLEVLPNGKHRPVILAGNMMWDELAKAPDLVINKQGTPKEILDQITDKINSEIEKKKRSQ